MGCCQMKRKETNNNSENFIREVLEKHKLRGIDFRELRELYTDLAKESVDKLIIDIGEEKDKGETGSITRGKLFNEAKEIVYTQVVDFDPYSFFHNELFNFKDPSLIDYDPECYFYIYCLSLTTEPDQIKKFEHFGTILEIIDRLTVSGFIEIISIYLYINIVDFTKLINNGVRLFDEELRHKLGNGEQAVIHQYTIDDEFIKNCYNLEKIFSIENVNNLVAKIKKTTEEVLMENKGLKMHSKIRKKDIRKILVNYDYIDDCILLRNYFYDKYK